MNCGKSMALWVRPVISSAYFPTVAAVYASVSGTHPEFLNCRIRGASPKQTRRPPLQWRDSLFRKDKQVGGEVAGQFYTLLELQSGSVEIVDRVTSLMQIHL